MRRLFKELLFVTGSLSCGLVIGATWPGWPYGYSFSETLARIVTAGTQETRFAPRYSETTFNRIELGMNQEEVLNGLGSPLKTNYSGYWEYSEPLNIRKSDAYHVREISFEPTGNVRHKLKVFYAGEDCEDW
jgi:hypothetical protein